VKSVARHGGTSLPLLDFLETATYPALGPIDAEDVQVLMDKKFSINIPAYNNEFQTADATHHTSKYINLKNAKFLYDTDSASGGYTYAKTYNYYLVLIHESASTRTNTYTTQFDWEVYFKDA